MREFSQGIMWDLVSSEDTEDTQLLLYISTHHLGVDMSRTPILHILIDIDGSNIQLTKLVYPKTRTEPEIVTNITLNIFPLWAIAYIANIALEIARTSGTNISEWYSGQLIFDVPSSR